MYLMYADEAGDSGLDPNSPTDYFVLSAVVVHDLRWSACLDELTTFRRRLKDTYGLHMREELHAARMFSRPDPAYLRFGRHIRLAMVREFADQLATMPDLNVYHVVIDKRTKTDGYDVFTEAWKYLIQRFEDTIQHRNFTGSDSANERGMIFPDNTEGMKLQQLVRKMRRYNPVPGIDKYAGTYRDLSLKAVIEDPNFRDSAHSLFIQAADLCSFLMYQRALCHAAISRRSQDRTTSKGWTQSPASTCRGQETGWFPTNKKIRGAHVRPPEESYYRDEPAFRFRDIYIAV